MHTRPAWYGCAAGSRARTFMLARCVQTNQVLEEGEEDQQRSAQAWVCKRCKTRETHTSRIGPPQPRSVSPAPGPQTRQIQSLAARRLLQLAVQPGHALGPRPRCPPTEWRQEWRRWLGQLRQESEWLRAHILITHQLVRVHMCVGEE